MPAVPALNFHLKTKGNPRKLPYKILREYFLAKKLLSTKNRLRN